MYKVRKKINLKILFILFTIYCGFFTYAKVHANLVSKKEANDSDEIIINENNEALAFKIQANSKALIEPELLKNPMFQNDFVQGVDFTHGLRKDYLIGKSTYHQGDSVISVLKTSNNNVLSTFLNTNYGDVSNHVYQSKMQLIGPDLKKNQGIIKDNVLVAQGNRDAANTVADVGNDQYLSIFSGRVETVNGAGERVSGGNISYSPSPPARHDYNRSSVGIDGAFYSMAYFDKGASTANKKQFKTYQINQNGSTEKVLSLNTSFETYKLDKTLGVRANSEWFEGNENNSFTIGPNNRTVGINRLGMHTNKPDDPKLSSVLVWDGSGNIVARHTIKDTYVGDSTSQGISYQKGISDLDNYYFMEYYGKKDFSPSLYKLNVAKGEFTQEIEFPSGTELTFQQTENGILFYGNISQFKGFFKDYSHWGNENSLVVGRMSKEGGDYKIDFMNRIKSKQVLEGVQVLAMEEQRLFLAAKFSGKADDLVDEIPGGWQGKLPRQPASLLYGYINEVTDYAPAITKNNVALDINIDNPSYQKEILDENRLTALERTLITGSVDGNYTDEKSIKVFDSQDLDTSLGAAITQMELNRNINRAPHDTKAPIDWKALGFDKNQVGPQKVTYFIADSKLQQGVTTRWVNVLTKHTIQQENLYYDARNASISYADIASGQIKTTDQLKRLIKSSAWSGYADTLKDPTKYEDSVANKFSDNVVQFSDRAQVEALQNATTSQNAKPYPLDIKITGQDETVGKNLTKRVWIFVTNEQTTVDETNDVVMYANNYGLPLNKAKNETSEAAVKHADAKIYRYHTDELTTSLTPLADKNNLGGLGIDATDLVRIQTATELGDLEHIRLNYKQENAQTEVAITVTLYQGQSDVSVRFTNENNTSVHPDVVLKDKNINEPLKLVDETEISNALDKLASSGDYTLIKSPDPEYIVKETDNLITYIFEGHLRLRELPSFLSLEKGKISTLTQELEYSNHADDFIVKVRDTRTFATDLKPDSQSQRGDFKVSVALTKPFRHNESKKILNGALLKYGGQEIGSYNEGEDEGPIGGYGTVVIDSKPKVDARDQMDYDFILDSNKTAKETSKGWSLNVPPQGVQKGSYEAELTWMLEKTP